MSHYIKIGVPLVPSTTPPPTPRAGFTHLYAGNQDDLYWKDDSGSTTEVELYSVEPGAIPRTPTHPFTYTHFTETPATSAYQVFRVNAVTHISRVDADTPGIIGVYQIRSNTTANTIKRLYTLTKVPAASGGVFSAVFRVDMATDLVCDIGWSLRTTTTEVQDRLIMRLRGSSFSGEGDQAGTTSATSSSFTMTEGTWYYGVIYLKEDRSLATFKLYTLDGVQRWTDTITSGIPASNVGLYPSVLCYKSTATGATTAQMHLDFVGFGHRKGYLMEFGREP